MMRMKIEEEEKNNDELGELFQANNLSDLRLSYSRVSNFASDGPKALIHRRDTQSDGMDLGKLTDVMLFTPSKFDEEFIVFDGIKPTGQSGTLVDIILLNYEELPSDDVLLKLVKINNLWSNIKDEDKLKAKWNDENFETYVSTMFKAKGKTVVTGEMFMLASELALTLASHEYTKDIFRSPHKHEDFYNQFEVEFDYNNFRFRGILDRLIINHIDKTIQMVDLKTGAFGGTEFMSSFVKFKYYLQEAIYSLAVNHIKEKLGLDEEYTLLPFLFVYIGKGDQIPLIYEVTDTWHKAALYGFTTTNGYKYKGLNELLEDIDWHWSNQRFDLPREVYESKGCLTLKDDFIVANG